MPRRICEHLAEEILVEPSGSGCEECLKSGGKWVHLRMCLDCGHIGCCDSSPGKHATMHYHESGHATMRSAEAGETWRWCYVDQLFVE